MEEDDYLYESLEKHWVSQGRPCPKCETIMVYDSKKSNEITDLIPGNIYGTREPRYGYYKCPKCGYIK